MVQHTSVRNPILIAALTLTTPALALGPVVPEVASSSGSVVVTDCYGGQARHHSGYGYGRGGSAAPPAKSTASGRSVHQAPSPAPSVSARSPIAEASADYYSGEAEYEVPAAPEPALRANAPASREESRRVPPVTPYPEPAPPTRPPVWNQSPGVSWGGRTWLSNDDSMSLASAQRLLYALERGARVQPSEIRPHELLNYFSFQTQAPRGRDTFTVQTSALQTGADTLSVAFAVQGAMPPRPNVDLTVLVDRSGSMSAEGRMDYTKKALHLASKQLKKGDRIDLVLFDHDVCTPLRDFVVGRDNPSLLHDAIERMQPRGSTDLDAGLRESYRLAKRHPQRSDRSTNVMVLTDAILNTGNINPHTVTEVAKAVDSHGIRLAGIGVGSDFRDDVLDMLTEKGKGAYVFLGSERVVDRVFGHGFDTLLHTLALDVRFAMDLPDSLGLKKFYGEEASRDPRAVKPVNYHAGNSQLFLQDLAIRDGRVRDSDEIKLTVEWTPPGTQRRESRTFASTVGQAMRSDTHNVRKGLALMSWTDMVSAHALGGNACGEPLQTFRERLSWNQGDAELAYVAELASRWCGEVTPIAHWTAPAATRIRLDSDIPIGEVALSCPSGEQRTHLGMGESVASFQTRPGSCTLTLYGNVPMSFAVHVPETGADMRCLIRAGRGSCS